MHLAIKVPMHRDHSGVMRAPAVIRGATMRERDRGERRIRSYEGTPGNTVAPLSATSCTAPGLNGRRATRVSAKQGGGTLPIAYE
jgi:hypothetical protein